ncbi:MAG: hypothetical protein AABX99_04065 [Nanoarchaeota archaeon]
MNNKDVAVSSIFVAVILLIIFLFLLFYNPVSKCNDGTKNNECTKIKPYFCSNGHLIKNVSFCGCSNFSSVQGNECFSNYQFLPKNITLNYTVDGKSGKIDFVVYGKLSDYLSNLPRYMRDNSNPGSILLNFKLRSLDNEQQNELLAPLVIAIQNLTSDKENQARIAISIVQNIPFGNSNKTLRFGGIILDYYRYPYEVLYDLSGVCGEKSELLAFLLRGIGYESAFIYYAPENHEALGVKCPTKKSLNNTGYCFIETTGPSIITDYQTEYTGIGNLKSTPEIIPVPDGNFTFGEKNYFYEYDDAKLFDSIKKRAGDYGTINFIQHLQYQELKKKYGLRGF